MKRKLNTNSDKIDQHIRKLQKQLRKPTVRPTQTHQDKRRKNRRNLKPEDME